jgi:hypothetical protein
VGVAKQPLRFQTPSFCILAHFVASPLSRIRFSHLVLTGRTLEERYIQLASLHTAKTLFINWLELTGQNNRCESIENRNPESNNHIAIV